MGFVSGFNPVAIDLNNASQQCGSFDSTTRGWISESLDWTVAMQFESDKSSSGNQALLGVTNGTNDRIAIVQEGTSLRCRNYDAGTTKAKSGTIPSINAVNELYFTNDAAGDAIKAWLNGTELTGSSTTAVNSTTGGFIGSASNGADNGSQLTFEGRIWNLRIWKQKITSISDLDGINPDGKYSFIESTPTTSNNERGSGGITWQNSPSFVPIPS